LQTEEHKPQDVQLSSLILILKTDTLEIKPKNAPTGQTVLQYNRPLAIENHRIKIKNADEKRMAKRLEPVVSMGLNQKMLLAASCFEEKLLIKMKTGFNRVVEILPKALYGSRTVSRKIFPKSRNKTTAPNIEYLTQLYVRINLNRFFLPNFFLK
jgi:hypothetical protein